MKKTRYERTQPNTLNDAKQQQQTFSCMTTQHKCTVDRHKNVQLTNKKQNAQLTMTSARQNKTKMHSWHPKILVGHANKWNPQRQQMTSARQNKSKMHSSQTHTNEIRKDKHDIRKAITKKKYCWHAKILAGHAKNKNRKANKIETISAGEHLNRENFRTEITD